MRSSCIDPGVCVSALYSMHMLDYVAGTLLFILSCFSLSVWLRVSKQRHCTYIIGTRAMFSPRTHVIVWCGSIACLLKLLFAVCMVARFQQRRSRHSIGKSAHTHVHTYSYLHTRTHASTQERTHALAHAYTNARQRARIYARTHIRTHARTHSHIHVHSHAHTLARIHACARARARPRVSIHTHTRT